MDYYQQYTYTIRWSAEDDEFIGSCAEFPSLSYLDEDWMGAIEGIAILVRDVIADMETNGESIPAPFNNNKKHIIGQDLLPIYGRRDNCRNKKIATKV